MALPNFFPRAALAASHVLGSYDQESLASDLNRFVVALAFDEAAAASFEGRTTLELVTNLLSRLYPALSFIPLDSAARDHLPALRKLARAINPEVSIAARAKPTVCVVVGSTPPDLPCQMVFAGSDGWLAKVATRSPVKSGETENPFGAAAAAAIAAANVFRHLFARRLPNAELDESVSLSLVDGSQGKKATNPSLRDVDLGTTHLVGLGAIGNAAVWTLARLPRLGGHLHLIDHEAVELSNLQRYVLTTQASPLQAKTDLAIKAFGRRPGLELVAHQKIWASYVSERGDYRFERVAVALDSVRDRIEVQGSLPRWVCNAWTQLGDLGVSRHEFLGEGACMACLYMPLRKAPDLDELVASAIGLPSAKHAVRQMLHLNVPITREFLQEIATAKAVPIEKLLPFEGKTLHAFYAEAVCGSTILESGSSEAISRAEVPLAFQSALAGVCLASELVCHAAGLKPRGSTSTKLDLLRRVPEHLVHNERKRPGGRCLCQDPDYVTAYTAKYASA